MLKVINPKDKYYKLKSMFSMKYGRNEIKLISEYSNFSVKVNTVIGLTHFYSNEIKIE